MSFSSQVKQELCHVSMLRPCCQKAELYGMLLFASAFSNREIRLSSELGAVMKRVQLLVLRVFSAETEITENGRRYSVDIPTASLREKILKSMGYDMDSRVVYHLNRNILENDCCLPAFLRGVFLMAGSLSSPESKSHLEISTTHRSLVHETVSLMLDLSLQPKTAERQGRYQIYFKDSGGIEDFLTMMGAQKAALQRMEAQVEKNIRNQINRQVNCETANLVKSADASARQVAAIRKMTERFGERAFPENLRETVRLRLAYPTDSLAELAQRFDPPISKPGLNHRLHRIIALATEEKT